MPTRTAIVEQLLQHSEPSIRFKLRVHVLGEHPHSKPIRALRDAIQKSSRVKALLRRKDAKGHLRSKRHIYDKWHGAHWILATLADIGYPPGDRSLQAAADDALACWLGTRFYQEFEPRGARDVYQQEGVPRMQGRYRRCASQQGNALWSLLQLGLLDRARASKLVERLLYWQWPDGGWNCDKNPLADSSSFMETLLPMRGLALYARQTGDLQASAASLRAADVFLARKLFKRRRDSKVIREEFLKFHYPLYWHYDILAGLKVLSEMDLLGDPRCNDALDLLESKRLPDGGWPAEARYYKVTSAPVLGGDYVDWGGTGKKKMNPWVTVDALSVLRRAGRLDL